ncbi:MAG TPA: translation initiation factor IF-2 [Patescibacteria group bacterium]|jgi:translation initiation factor IF-2|nr:translation initiation factor IF-2 [Patescibacteria group bacterium]
MNLSSLSHELNISINELRTKANAAGFRISPRANKIDNYLAKQIAEALKPKPKVDPNAPKPEAKKVSLPAFIKVRDFADLLELPVTNVIKALIQNGVMATINEEVDFETATIIAQDLGFEVATEQTGEAKEFGIGFLQEELLNESTENPAAMQTRPPIVAVMGHVDHGKTTLLDAIRKASVVDTESGGITQHIGAYQVKHDGKVITFLDTPGHEAFVEMRARGANVTDMIILVVAADDSVRPQTIEVINRAKFTNTPLIVAINKIDKENANVMKTKQELAEHGVLLEDWGGKVIAVEISAKNNVGIDKLLEMVLLQAEVEDYKANPEGKVLGTVIESHVAQGKGAVATVIVQNGTLKVGDIVVAGTGYGRVKSLEDEHGKKLKFVAPSRPALISGFSDLPEAGDILQTIENLDEARTMATNAQKMKHSRKLTHRSSLQGDSESKTLNLILKADVAGSLEAIKQSLAKLKNDEVQINILSEGIGEVNENDVLLADSSRGTVIAFHTKTNPKAINLAKQKKVAIESYDVIYELLENITSAVIAMFTPEMEKAVFGKGTVLAIFRTEKSQMIVGGRVDDGEIRKNKPVAIWRKLSEEEMAAVAANKVEGEEDAPETGIKNYKEIGRGEIVDLQQSKVDTKEVARGNEFGMKIKTNVKMQEGDLVESFEETLKQKTL